MYNRMEASAYTGVEQRMEHRIAAHVANWQNRLRGGATSICKHCGQVIYLDANESYRGPCPRCGKEKIVSSVAVNERLAVSGGGAAGEGRRVIHLKHLGYFLAWWVASVLIGAAVSGWQGIALSILLNVLLTIIGFRAFTFEIEYERF